MSAAEVTLSKREQIPRIDQPLGQPDPHSGRGPILPAQHPVVVEPQDGDQLRNHVRIVEPIGVPDPLLAGYHAAQTLGYFSRRPE